MSSLRIAFRSYGRNFTRIIIVVFTANLIQQLGKMECYSRWRQRKCDASRRGVLCEFHVFQRQLRSDLGPGRLQYRG